MQNDPEYHEQRLQNRKTKLNQKRKTPEEDPLHADARNEADRMAKVRRVAKEAQEVLDVQEREEMIEKVRRRISHTIFYI